MIPALEYANSVLIVAAVFLLLLSFVLVIYLSQYLENRSSKMYEIVGGIVGVILLWGVLLFFVIKSFSKRRFIKLSQN
jgi:phosphate/sulfate permease